MRNCTIEELKLLDVLGYTVCIDPCVPAHWMWQTPTDQSPMSYTSKAEAQMNAWGDATGNTLSLLNMTGAEWNQLDKNTQTTHMIDMLKP